MNLIQNIPTHAGKKQRQQFAYVCIRACVCMHTQKAALSGQFLLHWEAPAILTPEPDYFKYQRQGKKREYQLQGDVFRGFYEKLHLWPSFQLLINSLRECLIEKENIALRSPFACSLPGGILIAIREFSLYYSYSQRPL